MGENRYKGESPSKKLARLFFWKDAKDTHAHLARSKHLILASREGGDISTLLGFGVSPKNIVAVEREASAALAAQEKYPSVRVVCGSAAKIAKEYKRGLLSAHLDFCGTVKDEMLEEIVQVVLHGLKDDALLGVTVLSGRERGQVRDNVLDVKQQLLNPRRISSMSPEQVIRSVLANAARTEEIDDETKHLMAVLLRSDPDEMREAADAIYAERDELAKEIPSYLARAEYLRGSLLDRLYRFRVTLHPLSIFFYTSTTADSKGVPMCTILFRTRRFPPFCPNEKFEIKSNQMCLELGAADLVDCNRTENELRDVILELLESPEQWAQAHLLLNLPKTTLAAWKAHKTRGTYDGTI